MILFPIPNSFLRGKPPVLRRLAFSALLAGAIVAVLLLSGAITPGFFRAP